MISNLVTSALEFTPPGGYVRDTLRRRLGGAVLELPDSGPGIAADELPHVFDRFFRGPGARVEGSGIGLMLVLELVMAHGGAVTVGNAPGGGAVFTVNPDFGC